MPIQTLPGGKLAAYGGNSLGLRGQRIWTFTSLRKQEERQKNEPRKSIDSGRRGERTIRVGRTSVYLGISRRDGSGRRGRLGEGDPMVPVDCNHGPKNAPHGWNR